MYSDGFFVSYEMLTNFFLLEIILLKVGVAELKVAVEKTGGIVVLAESFGHSVFKDSFRRIFQSNDYDLGLSFK